MRWFKKKTNPLLDKLLYKLYEKATIDWERSYRLQGNGYPCLRSFSCGYGTVDSYYEYKTSVGSFEIFLGLLQGDTGGSQPDAVTEYFLEVVDTEQGIIAEYFYNDKKVVKLFGHIRSKIEQAVAEAEAQEKAIASEKLSRRECQARERLKRLLDI